MKNILCAFCLLTAGIPAHAAPAKPVTLAMEKREFDVAKFEAAVNKLKDLDIIQDAQFWIDNARPGKFLEAQPVRDMIIAAASKFQPVDNIKSATEVLQQNKILNAGDKWGTDLTEKNKFAGGVVAIMIIQFADKIN